MPAPLPVACLQTRPRPDFAAATDEAIGLAEEAVEEGARFLLLPEYCGGLRSEGPALVPPAAPEDSHLVLAALRDFARARRVWILVGSLAVSSGEAGRFFNRSFLLDERGEIRARYDKIHLFDVQLSPEEVYRESARVVPGDEAVVAETPIGPMGLTICYDLRFPHLYRDLAHDGAEVLAVPAAFTRRTGEAHWHLLNRARAVENGAFVVAPCAIGPVPGGGACYGHSLVVDPWGRVLADGGERPGVVRALIDRGEVAAVRGRIPSLRHDRPYRRGSAAQRGAA